MRLALVHRDLHATTRGGIGTLYRALAPRLRDAGHEVALITLHYARRPTPERAPVVIRGDLSAATMRAVPDLINTERELVQIADTVVAVSDFAATDLAMAYRIPRPAVIANGVDRDRFRPGQPRPPTGGRRITLAADATAASSRPLADMRTPLPPPWGDPGGQRQRLVWVGKTTPMKGWDRLERLLAELADLAHITVLLGHAPALSPITLSGDEPTVTILQDLPEQDLPSFYRAADYLLSTSRWEGFGLAIAEALACGTPVLLPAELGTAPELLATGGGHTYRAAADLRDILTTGSAPAATLPARFDWDTAAATTLTLYRRVHTAVASGPCVC